MLKRTVLSIALLTAGLAANTPASADDINRLAAWSAKKNLEHILLHPGLGEPLEAKGIASVFEKLLPTGIGAAQRPIVKIYNEARPQFSAPSGSDPARTLQWQKETLDDTVTPSAHAWAIIKLLALDSNAANLTKKTKVDAEQLSALASLIGHQLKTKGGIFVRRKTDEVLPPRAIDQAVALWAFSQLALSSNGTSHPNWQNFLNGKLKRPALLETTDGSLKALMILPPVTPFEKAISIQALGRFAIATENERQKHLALSLAESFAKSLKIDPGKNSVELASSIYGLIEAGRLLSDFGYEAAGFELFRDKLAPQWDELSGAFKEEEAAPRITPNSAGITLAALKAVSFFAPESFALKARSFHASFLETVLVKSGLQLTPPNSATDFPKKSLSNSHPVFIKAVEWTNGTWRTVDSLFNSEQALFFSVMLETGNQETSAIFLPRPLLVGLM